MIETHFTNETTKQIIFIFYFIFLAIFFLLFDVRTKLMNDWLTDETTHLAEN